MPSNKLAGEEGTHVSPAFAIDLTQWLVSAGLRHPVFLWISKIMLEGEVTQASPRLILGLRNANALFAAGAGEVRAWPSVSPR